MQDFKTKRENLDRVLEEVKAYIKKKSVSGSMQHLDEANNLLTELKKMADGDIQDRVIINRFNEIEYLKTQIENILSKREAGKKEDGNIALKCNWNDRYYKAPCSLTAYRFNLAEGRAWCSSSSSKCREFTDEVSLDNHPCYESIALKEMFFAAGWDHTGETDKPRHIHSVRPGRVAFLTTRPPGTTEKERIVIGWLFIRDVIDDPGEETKIYGDKNKSMKIDYDEIKVNFWDYYKNAGNEDVILWASGLFRYISDETVLKIFRGVGEQYKNSGRDVSKILEMVKYYEELINKNGKSML